MDDSSVDKEFSNVGAAAEAMAVVDATVSLGAIAKASPRLVQSLKLHCPVKTAASFGGLLLRKQLQSNCLRLEVLVHLALAHGMGRRPATPEILHQGFAEIGQQCGYLEDPREDVFVGGIYSKRGNYRVLEGIWEASTFYLQRFVNMTDELPEEGMFAQISDAIHAFLKLSDAVCERASLSRHDIGPDGKNDVLLPSLAVPDSLSQLISFTASDLTSLGIDLEDLSPFIFNPGGRGALLKQKISHSTLEAAPLTIKDGTLYLVLPTAVTVAIRRFFLRMLGEGGNKAIFLNQIGREYSRLFSTSPFFGEPGPSLPFEHAPFGSYCGVTQRIDVGRYLNVVFFLDDLRGFSSDAFAGVFHGTSQLQRVIHEVVQAMQVGCQKDDDFKDGVTLIVGCGVGRGVALEAFHQPPGQWLLEFLSAPDLMALSALEGRDPLNLARVLRMEESLRRNGVVLQNINGLLNLFAWADSLDGHLIPHAEIPEDFKMGKATLLMPITQNGLGDLRHRLALKHDQHVEQFVDGSWRLVRQDGGSYFQEDYKRPLYVHLDMGVNRRLLGVRVTRHRCWWYEAAHVDGVPNALTYERWAMMGVWIARIADEIDRVVGDQIGSGPVLWRCVFDGSPIALEPNDLGQEADLLGAFESVANFATRTIELRVGAGFNKAVYHPHNIAEVGLVRALLTGIESLFGASRADMESALAPKLSDVHARHSHVFSARNYRDYFRDSLSASPVTINRFDVALLKLGLGWRARDPGLGGRIEGKSECLSLLNQVVSQLQDELIELVKPFDRETLLRALLENYESASHSRDWWHRTAAAVLALRDDKEAAMSAMSEHESRLNGALLPTRNLIEVVLCESPLENGIRPGDMDIALLMVQAAQIFHLSGWSDLIHWNMLEPELVIRPLGDIHARHDFLDEVMDPFGKATSENRYSSSVKGYAKSLATQQPTLDLKDMGISSMFLTAWQSEFGAPLDAFRRFLDALEDWGTQRRKMIFVKSKSELVRICETTEIGEAIITALELPTRPNWNHLPEGFSWKDIAPARFRRRLGLLRRPLIMFEPGVDPRYLVNPALVREGFVVMFRNYYEGSYADEHLGPSMRKYAGEARKRDGAEFNEKVALRMVELGWRVEREIKLTKILKKGLDRDYGDVDVLAWQPSTGRILVMECKDLQFKKTYGEIAEQLSDYRGRLADDGKKRDSLRKHLDRIEVLRGHSEEVGQFLGFSQIHKIESHLVFSNPVPMMFSSVINGDVAAVHTYDSLDGLRGSH